MYETAHHGKHPNFNPIQVDLFEGERTTELIKSEKPDAIINCTVLHTWHLIRQLPDELYKKISSAGLGAWLPCQLALGLNLAKSIQGSGLSPYYINISLSCLTNPVMGKVGLAPTIGIGNVDLIAPAVLTYVAQQKGIDRFRIETFHVCHHLKDALGFDCKSFHAWDSKELAFEQMACFRKLAEKYIN